jgi:hypothetical protein
MGGAAARACALVEVRAARVEAFRRRQTEAEQALHRAHDAIRMRVGEAPAGGGGGGGGGWPAGYTTHGVTAEIPPDMFPPPRTDPAA